MNKASIGRAAQKLAKARRDGSIISLLPPADRPKTKAEGYVVQKAVHALLATGEHGAIAGYKVGATKPEMQTYLGVDSPIAGGMYAKGIHPSGMALRRDDFIAPGVECEIALTLGADLPASGAPYTQRSVARAVATCHAAVEVADNRYKDFRAFGTASLVADDFFHGAFVYGRPVAPKIDLAAAKGHMTINGKRFGTGSGADLMGHPYAVLAWLANHLAETGQPLKAGHIIACGSVTPVGWFKDLPKGEKVIEVAFAGLGEVRLRFY
ncbi:MAG: hydratase [Rhodospirillales bacterium]|nr:hydratase [Rhodospirillales bacterium]